MKKKSHSIFAVLALALVIAAAIVVFALIRKYTPSKEHEDLTTYYHLTNSDEVAIVLNNEVTSSKPGSLTVIFILIMILSMII